MKGSPFSGVNSGSKGPNGSGGGIDHFSEKLLGGGKQGYSSNGSYPSTPGPSPVGIVGNPTAFNPSKKY